VPTPNRKSEQATRQPIRVGMISLGCAKNLVDAEIMLGSVLQRGMEITARAEEADVLVVNTCAFIDSAKEESIDAILEAHQQRGLNRRPNQKLIVSGCMAQRFSNELRQALPEVDAFIGLDQVSELGIIVEQVVAGAGNPSRHGRITAIDIPDAGYDFVTPRPSYIPDYDTPRFRLTPTHSAYLKVAEGCNHPCSFCVIPQMRGKHRSRPVTSVLAEIRGLVSEGVREINLISQDTTYYGMDLWPEKAGPRQPVDSTRGPTLSGLLREIQKIEGEFWVRLLIRTRRIGVMN
jgi:ribosomal protein S12 methylthiotransferase